ncbi:MAG: class II aldolase/adducin family protein [Oscillospiraceae bacterium]
MNYKAQLIDGGKRLLAEGLTIETWGNLSLRDPDTGLCYVTPSALPYDSLGEEDIVVLELDGTVIDGGRKPSVETGLHLGLYRARADVNAILHTHPRESMVFAALHQAIPCLTDEMAQTLGGGVPVAAYALPGTAELAKNVRDSLGADRFACLLANHGAVCVGSELAEAFRVCTVLEASAQLYRRALTIGQPRPLDPPQIATLYDFARNRYGQEK